MFLHIVQPDLKFPPLIRDLYEAYVPGQSVYVLLGEGDVSRCVHEGYAWAEDVEALRRIIESIDNLEGVIINGLLESFSSYLCLLPEGVPLAWSLWGYDVAVAGGGGAALAALPTLAAELAEDLLSDTSVELGHGRDAVAAAHGPSGTTHARTLGAISSAG